MTPILNIDNLAVSYSAPTGTVRAVDGVSLSVGQGEAFGLVGESGAGKSSLGLGLIRLLPRNVSHYSGRVEMNGVDCMALSNEEFRKQIRWKQISMVFQGALDSLNPVMRVGHQIAEPYLLSSGVTRKEAYQEVTRLLGTVLLPPEIFHRYPHELSGGMKQRVVIAMALILSPPMVILDEPTSALDVSVQAQIMNLLKGLKTTLGLSFLFITHDIALASDLCDTIGVMYAGQMVEVGPAEQVLTAPQHPYTQKLLASIPSLTSDSRPEFISGTPPDLADPPPGCRFHPRCPYAFDRCPQEMPTLFTVGPNHEARCWLVEERGRD